MARKAETPSWLRRGLLILKLAVAVALIWWLLASGRMDLGRFRNLSGRWHWVFLAIAACGVVQVLTVWRWRLLLAIQGIRYGYSEAFRTCMVGLFFNQFMLGSVGGDLYRVYAVARDNPGARSAGAVSVLADRVSGLVMSLLLVPLALIFTWDYVAADTRLGSLIGLVAVLVVAGALFGICLVSRRLRRLRVARAILERLPMQSRLKRIDHAIRVHADHPGPMTTVLLTGLLAQVFVVLTNVCLAFALIPELDSVAIFFLLIPLALVAMALPINPPGAAGTGEALYQYLLSLVAIPSGSLLSLLQRAVLVLWAIPGGVLFLAGRGRAGRVDLSSQEAPSP